MSEEKLPLIVKNINGNHENNSGNTSRETSISFQVPIYGTHAGLQPGIVGKSIPADERITYTWNSLNVFTNTENQKTDPYFCCCKRSGYQTVSGKHLLKNVSGVAYPGELLAILGSSGAGKTTLLNALTFRSPKSITVTGTRCVNGVPVNSKSLTSQSAYVQQDDLFIGSLTVKEHLKFQALVRMDRHISYENRMERVEEVMSEMNLNKCANTCIGIPGRLKGISGGEQKRLSFASEVLTNPSLMFCDEPTSGVDSFMALNVVQILKNMAHAGRTVICTIHQPSSEVYSMFDKLLLMAEGRIAFLGTPEEADLFFRQLEAPCPKNYNPADYFIQLLAIAPGNEESCRQAVNMICDKFEKSEQGIKVALESETRKGDFLRHSETEVWINGSSNGFKSPYKASWFAQFRAVLWRSWLSIIKEPLLMRVRLMQTILVSLMLGAIYYGQVIDQDGVMNINGVLFIFLTNMTFQNVFAVISVFSSELPIFLREHRNGMYRTEVYFLGKTLADIPIFIFIPILFTTTCYFIIGLNSEMPRFFVACGIIILVANAATSFGYLISCASSTISMAVAVGPPLIVPFLLFGGFFLNIDSIPIYFEWLSYLSWFKYGNEALMINQWENVTSIQCPFGNSTCPKDGHIVLEMYSFDEENFIVDLSSLLGLILGFRLLAYFALLWKTYKYEKGNKIIIQKITGNNGGRDRIRLEFSWKIKQMFTPRTSGSSTESTQLTLLRPDRRSTDSYLNDDSDNFESSGSFGKKCRSYSRWSPMEEGITLAWNDLTIYAKAKTNGKITYKRIINSVTGAIKPGSLVAVMGASGAGKSTLMAALAYRNIGDTVVEGDILINGRPIGNYMKYLSGCMPQEDLYVASLTVLEHMNIMAHLKLDRRVSNFDKSKKIRSILNQLGLTKCISTRIGAVGESKGLSGGERKRLAFATELLTDPPILFCDEPTTGLDSFSAEKLVSLMSRMTSGGKTILCSIHQPSSQIFGMFTQLILIADGRIAYMGSRGSATEFFEKLGFICPSSYSPADFFIKTLATTPGFEQNSRLAVKKICDHFAVSDYAKEVDVVVQYEFHMGRAQPREFELRTNFKEPFWWQKLCWLIYRWSLEALRNPSVQALRILQRITIAVIVGLSYCGTNPLTQNGVQAVQGAIFIFVTENTFNPMYSVLAEFPENTPIFLREFRSGLYHPVTYYLSRIIALLPGFIVEPLLFVVIAYWISGLRTNSYAFFMTILITMLTTNVASACGIMFSNAFDSVPTAMAYLVPFDYILMVTSGLFVKLGTLPQLVSWMKYLSWLMYSTESLSIVQWEGITNITCDTREGDLPCVTDGSAVLDKYSFSGDNLASDMWNMFFLLIAFHFLGCVCLWWKTTRR
ncbi:ABC transporter G family member 5-like [Cylas formicarius]|uniref:ABC transporter G family member 5-like n=1 Tax=Cylas formicarius TaxID=197179 RepID=UPI00295875FF|nr:ABC transporter G family member 5-like [Cylas formicarius]